MDGWATWLWGRGRAKSGGLVPSKRARISEERDPCFVSKGARETDRENPPAACLIPSAFTVPVTVNFLITEALVDCSGAERLFSDLEQSLMILL